MFNQWYIRLDIYTPLLAMVISTGVPLPILLCINKIYYYNVAGYYVEPGI